MNLQSKFKEMGIGQLNKEIKSTGYKVFQFASIESVYCGFNIAPFQPVFSNESKLPKFLTTILNGAASIIHLDTMKDKQVFTGSYKECQDYIAANYPNLARKPKQQNVGAI